MSNAGARDGGQERQGLAALEVAVNRAVGEIQELRKRADQEAARNAGLETLLMSFQTGSERPDRMQERLDQLEAENRDLRARIMQGRESVERLLARIQFLEDQK